MGCLGCFTRGGSIAALVALAITVGSQANVAAGVLAAAIAAVAIGIVNRRIGSEE